MSCCRLLCTDRKATLASTVNLAPADLPKESGRFDLPIAIGILAALGEVDLGLLEGLEFAGELSLGGELRPVRGALAMALALRQSGDARRPRSLVLPMASAREAALVDGVRILGANRLLGDTGAQVAAEPCWTVVTRPEVPEVPFACGDLMDVRGQGVAKRALELAASAGHSLLMVGPPGTGKSMLAHRLASILPPLEVDDALESAAVLSLAGCFEPAQWRQRRVRAPHHSASSAALVGGGCDVSKLMRRYRHNCDTAAWLHKVESRIAATPIDQGQAPFSQRWIER